MRRQVPGNRRTEHPVADDQEVHDGIIPRTPDGRNRMHCADTGSRISLK